MIQDTTNLQSAFHSVIMLLLFTLLFCVFVNRDGLLFELENGKPKLIVLSHGEFSTYLLFTLGPNCHFITLGLTAVHDYRLASSPTLTLLCCFP